jgi:hypothetical protein
VLSRACKGLKPITTIERRSFGERASPGAGRGHRVAGGRGEPVVITVTGIVGDRLDVKTLIAGWARYLQESPNLAVLDRIERELRRVAKLPFSVFGNTQWSDASAGWSRGCRRPGTRPGLLYGCPRESTTALVGEGLGIPGRIARIVNPELEFGELVCDGHPTGQAQAMDTAAVPGQLPGVGRTRRMDALRSGIATMSCAVEASSSGRLSRGSRCGNRQSCSRLDARMGDVGAAGRPLSAGAAREPAIVGHMTPEGQHWFADLQRGRLTPDAAARERDRVARRALAHGLGIGDIARVALRIDRTTAQSHHGDQPSAG